MFIYLDIYRRLNALCVVIYQGLFPYTQASSAMPPLEDQPFKVILRTNAWAVICKTVD
jgi:hypothetical protein